MDESTQKSVRPKPPSAIEVEKILDECKIEYEPELIPATMFLVYSITKMILEQAQQISRYAKKNEIDQDEVNFAAKTFDEKYHPMVNKLSLEKIRQINRREFPEGQVLTSRMTNECGLLVPNYRFKDRSIEGLDTEDETDNNIPQKLKRKVVVDEPTILEMNSEEETDNMTEDGEIKSHSSDEERIENTTELIEMSIAKETETTRSPVIVNESKSPEPLVEKDSELEEG